MNLMNLYMAKSSFSPALLLAGGILTSSLGGTAAFAQSYTATDLSPNAGNGVATGISTGVAAGYSASGIFGTGYHAMLWDANGATDLHPSYLDDAASGTPGRSSVLDIAGGIQVGWGASVALTANRPVPMAWRGTSASAGQLAIPFTNFGGQATATDGTQIVGYATGLNRDGTTVGTTHAMLWDAATGAVTDLGDGGNGAMAYGVGGGAQVGYVLKPQANAALWRGDSRTLLVLHPKNAVLSVANATDGVRQVGYAGYDVRVRQEAAKGNKDARFNYATLWSGGAATAVNIHPYPVNLAAGVNLTQSYALGMNGNWIVGFATDATKSGGPAFNHAIVWDSVSFQSVDLNAFLPAGFVGAQATSVDENGNVSGFMSLADGTRHAVVWTLNPAQ